TTSTGALVSGPDNVAYAVLRRVAPDATRTLTNLRRTLVAGDSESLLHEMTTAHDATNDASTTNDATNTLRTSSNEQESPVELLIGADLAARTGLRQLGDEVWLITGERVAE